jgi:hypothetical protein
VARLAGAALVFALVYTAGSGGYDAGIPGTPQAEIHGSGVLVGWTVTIGGTPLCDSLDVRTWDRTIECEFDEE